MVLMTIEKRKPGRPKGTTTARMKDQKIALWQTTWDKLTTLAEQRDKPRAQLIRETLEHLVGE